MATTPPVDIKIVVNVEGDQKVEVLGTQLSDTAEAAQALGDQATGAAGGLGDLAGGAGTAADDTGALGEALADAVDAAGALGEKSADTASNADALDAALAAAAASAQALGGETDGAVPRVDNLQGAMTALGVVSDESLNKTAETARIAYEQLKASGTASARELEDAFKIYAERAIAANGGVASDTIKAEAAMRGLQVQTDSAGRAIVTSMGAAEKATGGFLDSMRGKLTAVAAAVASYLTVDFFVGAINGSGDLEQALDRVQSATHATVEEMALLRKAAEDSGVDSIAAADALANLARAGLSAKDAIGALPAVISLAKAGEVELGEAAEFLSKAVMGMGMEFSEAARVADVLALGANATNTSVKGLAEGLSYAAPVAQSLGLSLETTVAIIGKFADAGIDASRAGTALNSILSQFGDPASKFRGELAAAGITTGNFEEALHQLAAAGPRGAKAINAVGQEAGPALRALLNLGMPALDELVKKLGSAEGAAAAAAAVMDANLNGSMTSLGVAWKYVTDTLGAPVLPVITSAVNDLTAALRGAVQDGTVGKFGEVMAVGFQSGIKWAKDFLAQMNFTQISADLRVFADKTGAVFVQIGEYASTAGNTVKLVYGVMSAGTNTVLGGVYLIGEAFAGVASNIQAGLSLLYTGLSKITFGDLSKAYKQAADEVRLSAGATWAASEELGKKSQKAFDDAAKGAEMARNGFTGLAGAATSAQPAVDASAQAIGEMAKQLEAAAEKNAAARKATEDKKAADEAAAIALRQLREEYTALVDKGDLQGAADKIKEINKALQATPAAAADATKAADAAAKALDDAFQSLGITSSAELNRLAVNAKASYETIKNDGTSTAADISNAFKVMAEKAIAANNGIAPSWVTAEAGARGLEVQVDKTGKSILKSMGEGGQAVAQLGEQFNMTAEQIQANEEAIDRLMMKYTQSANYSERQIALLEKENDLVERRNALERERLNIDKEGYSLNTAGERVSVQVESKASIYERAKGQGLTEAQALQLSNKTALPYNGPSIKVASPLDDGSNWSTRLQQDIDKLKLQNAAANSGSTAQTKTYKVDLTVNGRPNSFNMASDADAQNLIKALQSAQLTAS